MEAKGVRCWMAPRDILPGADWGESIIDAINDAKAMVLVFSPTPMTHSCRSSAKSSAP